MVQPNRPTHSFAEIAARRQPTPAPADPCAAVVTSATVEPPAEGMDADGLDLEDTILESELAKPRKLFWHISKLDKYLHRLDRRIVDEQQAIEAQQVIIAEQQSELVMLQNKLATTDQQKHEA